MGSILTSVTGFLGGIQTYLIVGAVTALVAASAGAYGGYRWEEEALQARLAQDAQAVTVATQEAAASQKAQDGVALAAAVSEAKAQDALHVKTVTLTERIPVYVTPAQDSRVCVTVGLVRVLRAAAAGADPATLQLAPGQSDDDCADLSASALAGNLTQALGDANQNAEQLNALEAWVIANHKAQVAP